MSERILPHVFRYGTVALLVLFAAPGCTSTDALLEPPHPRDEVNAALQRYPATITLKSGRVIERANEVHLGLDETEYVKRRRRTVPTDEVAEIKVHVRRGMGTAMFVGMLPGLYLIGAGVYGAVGASEGSTEAEVARLTILGGLAGLIAGGVIGSLIGRAAGDEETYVIYEGGESSG